MAEVKDTTKVIKMIKRAENYFYKYLLYRDKEYIDKFFDLTKQIKRRIEKWNKQ
jgi:CHASE3 domain sensor protein